MTKQRAIIELLFADLFWGFSFIAIPLAHKTWNSSNVAFLRFAIPVLTGFFLSLFIKKWRLSSREFRLGIAPGFFFAATIYSQTLGLEYTSPSKSSFITVLYVLFVPLLETYIHKKKYHSFFGVPSREHYWDLLCSSTYLGIAGIPGTL